LPHLGTLVRFVLPVAGHFLALNNIRTRIDLWLDGKSILVRMLLRARKWPAQEARIEQSVPRWGNCSFLPIFNSFMSRHFPTFAIPNPPPGSSRSVSTFYLRRAVFGIAFIIIYGLLDRTTVYLQIWPSISAWYPPVGLSVALFVGLGPSILPVIVVAGYLAGYLNYHQNVSSLPFLLTNPLLPVIYGTASLYLRRKLTGKYRIRSTSDVTALLGVSLIAALAAAVAGTAVLVWSGELSAGNYAQAAFNWWIGDAVALSSLTPFLLEFVLPWCRRYLGFAGAEESPPAAKSSGMNRAEILESSGFLASLAFLRYLAFENNFARSAHLSICSFCRSSGLPFAADCGAWSSH